MGVCRGKWVTLIQSMCMMLCVVCQHRLGDTAHWPPMNFLEGIPKRLIEGVKRQQLRSTILPYLHSRIPIEFVATEWCTQSDTSSLTLSRSLVHSFWSLRLISTPSQRQSTFELCVLLISLSRTWTASKLCRWLGGSVQRIHTPYFIQAKFLTLFTPLSFYWVKGYWIKFVDPTYSPSFLSRSWVVVSLIWDTQSFLIL